VSSSRFGEKGGLPSDVFWISRYSKRLKRASRRFDL